MLGGRCSPALRPGCRRRAACLLSCFLSRRPYGVFLGCSFWAVWDMVSVSGYGQCYGQWLRSVDIFSGLESTLQRSAWFSSGFVWRASAPPMAALFLPNFSLTSSTTLPSVYLYYCQYLYIATCCRAASASCATSTSFASCAACRVKLCSA